MSDLRRAMDGLAALAAIIERAPVDDVHLTKGLALDVAGEIRTVLAALAPAPAGDGDRYEAGYSQGTIDAGQQHQWMQDKAWQDAVLMLVHYSTLAERTWLVGHEEAARKLAEWWGHARALADTKSADDIAALARPRAAVGEREQYLVWSNEHQAWWGPDHRGYTRHIEWAGRYERAEALSIAGTRDGGWHVRKGNPDEIAILERDAVEQYAQITAAIGEGRV